MSCPHDTPMTNVQNPKLRKIVVSNFEDNGIVYCKDANNIVYDTEDVYFGAKKVRVIGTCVDGTFVPKPSTNVSSVSPPDCAITKTNSLPIFSLSADS